MRSTRVTTLTAAVCLAGSLLLTACGTTATTGSTTALTSGLPKLLQKAEKSGSIEVGTLVNAPIAYLADGSTDLSGITADIMREYLKRKGLEGKVAVKAETMDFSSLIPALQTKRIDYIIDTMYVTPERKKVVTFTDTLFFNPEALVVGTGNAANLHSLADLCGKTAASYEGSAYLKMLTTASSACSEPITVKTYPKVSDVINDVAAGRVDAGLIDATVAAYGLHENPSLGIELVSDYVPEDKTSTAAANAVLPGNDDFLADYDAQLAAMRSDGTLARILTDNGLSPAGYFLNS